MQLVIDIDIDDDIGKEFLTSISKDEQKNIFENLVKKYLTQITGKTQADDEVDFVGMWADREMNVDDFVRQSRQGRQFYVD